VSINKPHVRPIKRGKAGSDVEFSARVSASVVDGFVFVDRISWDNFNESKDLIDQTESCKIRFMQIKYIEIEITSATVKNTRFGF
jgi:hypothetical protein